MAYSILHLSRPHVIILVVRIFGCVVRELGDCVYFMLDAGLGGVDE